MTSLDRHLKLTEIGICSFNIHGVWQNINNFRYNKLQNPFVQKLFENYKIIGLIETHHVQTEIGELHVNGFKCHSKCRPKSNKKGKKPSGGLAVYIHNSIKPGVSILSRPGSESIWIKLDCHFFNLKQDVYSCFCYAAPANSPYLKRLDIDIYENLKSETSEFVGQGSLCFLGDFNARTGTAPDFITNEDNTNISAAQSGLYSTDCIGTCTRYNLDKGSNSYGTKLLELCRDTPLRILNGRKLGDLLGYHTCYQYGGSSVVDYGLVSPDLYDQVPVFTVLPFDPTVSDHSPIGLYLKVNSFVSFADEAENLVSKPQKLNWDTKIKDNFQNMINSSECKDILNKFMGTGINPDVKTVDAAVKFLSDILTETAERADLSLKHVQDLGPPPPLRGGRRGRIKNKRNRQPAWHNESCSLAYKNLQQTSRFLHRDPNNPWLRGKLFKEKKLYKKLIKQQQGQFLGKMFEQMDSCQSNDPKRYMELVKKIRDGTFDKISHSDSDSISPDDWRNHFRNLLGPKINKTEKHLEYETFIENNINNHDKIFEQPLKKEEILKAIKSLKNNKSASFDQVTNEMLKASMPVLLDPIFLLFKTMIDNSIYSTYWKLDILSPIHKKGVKDDPNNFRGIAVASHFGKLFNSVLKNRLESFCDLNQIVNQAQISGRAGARTADHLTVIRFLVEKYAQQGKKRLYACFFDLRKAFDTVDRTFLLFNLLSKYQIGGKFLKILADIYRDNEMYIKLSAGLTMPFKTTVGVKQGCVLSPLIFNLFINDLPDQFDSLCDPVHLGDPQGLCDHQGQCGHQLQALMYADDVVIFSQSAGGLKRAIAITVNYFNNINLSVNFEKSQVMVFNVRGLLLDKDPDHIFQVNGRKLKVVSEYTYLGFKLVPSGSASYGSEELFSKARRSWFAISNLVYRHKRMPTDRAYQIFDQLVASIGLYNCESWLPVIMSKKSFANAQNLFKFWESFKLEKINQSISRMLLGVHRKTSRLATIGELGRFPLFITGLCHTLKYKAHLHKMMRNGSLVGLAASEMSLRVDNDLKTWWGRTEQIQKILGLNNIEFGNPENIGARIKRMVKSKFEIFWLSEINKINLTSDGQNHNKLRFYAQLKGCFKKEPYIDLVPNRSQRSDLARLRTSSSRLAIEVMRYQRPPVPANQRYCRYCRPLGDDETMMAGHVDDEQHFLINCRTFTFKRNCFLARFAIFKPEIHSMTPQNKTMVILCPTSTITAKLANKFIQLMFESRKQLDEGNPIFNLGYEQGVAINPFFNDTDDSDDDSLPAN